MVVVKIYSHNLSHVCDLANMIVEVPLVLLSLGSSLEAQVQHLIKVRTHRNPLVVCLRLQIVFQLLLAPILIIVSLPPPPVPYILMLGMDSL
jgi:hypothetical protein